MFRVYVCVGGDVVCGDMYGLYCGNVGTWFHGRFVLWMCVWLAQFTNLHTQHHKKAVGVFLYLEKIKKLQRNSHIV